MTAVITATPRARRQSGRTLTQRKVHHHRNAVTPFCIRGDLARVTAPKSIAWRSVFVGGAVLKQVGRRSVTNQQVGRRWRWRRGIRQAKHARAPRPSVEA